MGSLIMTHYSSVTTQRCRLFFKRLKLRSSKRELDKGHQIVYLSGRDIEIFFMNKMLEGEHDLNLKNCVMIVDEVDSLIVDEAVYSCYVDHYQEGSDVCNWWCDEGRGEDPAQFPRWKQKIMRS